MKYKLIIAALLLTLGVTGFSQDLKDGKGDLLAIIDTSATLDTLGIFRSANQHRLLQFMSNGEILNSNGDVIGKIDQNNFKEPNDDLIGSINSAGEVFDINNMKQGEVIDSTTIKDVNGHLLGISTSSFNNKWLAFFYFFYFNNY